VPIPYSWVRKVDATPRVASEDVRPEPQRRPGTAAGTERMAKYQKAHHYKWLVLRFDSDPSLHGRPLTSIIFRQPPVFLLAAELGRV
jgi:hypothetical protein